MALQSNSDENATASLLQQHAYVIPSGTVLKGKCRWCPRAFESGEKIVFVSIKNIQMEWLEEDIETAEPAGFGERHHLQVVNAHIECALRHTSVIRSVVNAHL